MSHEHVILLVDPDFRTYFGELSGKLKNCSFVIMPDKGKACNYFIENIVDMAVIDHSERSPCMELLRCFKSAKPSVPVIVVTCCGSEAFAVNTFKSGARDYFTKPFRMDDVVRSIEHILSFRHSLKRRKSDHAPDNFRSVVQQINDNFHRKMRLPEIAREAGMSISCFERTFKKNMGVTFTAYVNNLRISRSVHLLKEDRFSANEIAYECGFTNQFHFSRTFKKIMNTPPRTFRKNLRNQD